MVDDDWKPDQTSDEPASEHDCGFYQCRRDPISRTQNLCSVSEDVCDVMKQCNSAANSHEIGDGEDEVEKASCNMMQEEFFKAGFASRVENMKDQLAIVEARRVECVVKERT